MEAAIILGGLSFVVLFVIVAARTVWVMGVPGRRDARWRAVAERGGLSFLPGGRRSTPAVFGVLDGTIVLLTAEAGRAGNSRILRTRATAYFSLPMPEGLHVTAEDLGSSFANALGRHDFIVGNPDLDDVLRIHGRNESALRALFGSPRAAAAISAFIGGYREACITERRATFVVPNEPFDEPTLASMLVTASRVVRGVEDALAVRPSADLGALHAAPEPFLLPETLRLRRAPATEGSPAPSPPATAADRPPPVPLTAPPAPSPAAGSRADEYIAQLAAEGVVESVGVFTIDRAAAREKARQHQLRAPEEYVLALVRCGVLKGAPEIDVTVDADDVRLRFAGRALSLADFEGLYGALFSGGRDPDLRARRQLALGATAAAALEPKLFHVVSSGGTGAVELVIRPGEEERFGPCTAKESCTTIHVKTRLREAFGGRRATIEELLRVRCASSPVPVRLNGDVISRGPALPETWGVVPVEGPGYRGLAGLSAQGGVRAYVEWVVDGVTVNWHELPGLPPGFRAVVDGSASLDLDISQSDVVRNRAYTEIVATVGASLPRVYQALAAQVGRPAPGAPPVPWVWAMDVLHSLARGYEDLEAFREGQPGAWLADLPLFQSVDLAGLSLRQLTRHVDEGGQVGHADHALPALAIPPAAPLRLVPPPSRTIWMSWMIDPRTRAFVARLFGTRLRSMTTALLGQRRDPALVERIVRQPWEV